MDFGREVEPIKDLSDRTGGEKIEIDGDGNVIGNDNIVTVIKNAPPAPIRLPLQKPSRVPHFTGRERELEKLLNDLQPGRMVTICGPGGMGKTALAAEAIWRLAPGNNPPERFPDGIIFHTFYHKPQEALALEAIARAYGVDPHTGALESARLALNGRQALIVLDGTEAASDLGDILSITGSCGVLITTRHHADAPADFSDLLPLPLDKAAELLQAWAGPMASDDQTCGNICNLLGCLPLAIFLAGRYMAHRRQLAWEYLTWLKKTPLEALDLGERQHQSIPLLMEHSLLQVSDQAQSCLGLTGVLALKPFEPQVVATALEIATEDANRSLGELVDFGLLMRPDTRYQITHALAHAYARERLAPPGIALARLADYYEDFISKQMQQGLAVYAKLDSQRDHILAVQSSCNRVGLWVAVRSITWAIDEYLDRQGHWVERIAVVQAGLEAARSDQYRYDEGEFLNLLGLAYAGLGEPRKAIKHYEKALKISREIRNRRGEGAVLGNLGNAYRNLGKPRKAIEYHKQALKISREVGDRRSEGAQLGNLGNAYAELGEPRKAIEYHKQALKISREIGDKRGEDADLGNLGNAYASLGEPRKAIEHYEQALKISREIGDRRDEANHLGNLGAAYASLGETCKAIEHFEQHLAIAREIGDRNGESIACWNLSLEYDKAGDLERAADLMKVCVDYKRKIGHPDAEKDAQRLDDILDRLKRR